MESKPGSYFTIFTAGGWGSGIIGLQPLRRRKIAVLDQQQAGIEGRGHGNSPGGVDDDPGDCGNGKH